MFEKIEAIAKDVKGIKEANRKVKEEQGQKELMTIMDLIIPDDVKMIFFEFVKTPQRKDMSSFVD